MSDKVGEEVRARVGTEVRSAIMEATLWHVELIEKLTAERDELLAACRAAVDCGMVPDELACAEGAALVPSDYATFLEVANQIRAAIAKTEVSDGN